MLAQAYGNVSNARERKVDGPGSLQCEGIDVAPVAAQRDGGSGLGIVKDDRPLRIAGDVFRIGLLRRSAKGLPSDCLVLGAGMGVEDIGDCDGALFTMAQLAILLVGQHFVAIAGVKFVTWRTGVALKARSGSRGSHSPTRASPVASLIKKW